MPRPPGRRSIAEVDTGAMSIEGLGSREMGSTMASEEKVGVVTHYYAQLGVAVIRLTDADLRVGDLVWVCGRTTDVTQPVTSLQIEHRPIARAERGSEVALKVQERVRRHDEVFRVHKPDWPSGIADQP